MTGVRWLSLVPNAVTGHLEPYRGEAGIAIEFTAPNREAALRMAAANRLPSSALIVRQAYDALRQPLQGSPGQTAAELQMLRQPIETEKR